VVDQVAPIELTDQLWRSLPSRAELPCDETDYFRASGVIGASGETRRQFTRMQLREVGVLLRGVERHAIYVRDVSPKGVAIYSPVQIFPLERLALLMDGRVKLDLILKRCRRVEEKSYECGAVFVDGAVPPSVYKRLIQTHGRGE
jgi:hypothetical protein